MNRISVLPLYLSIATLILVFSFADLKEVDSQAWAATKSRSNKRSTKSSRRQSSTKDVRKKGETISDMLKRLDRNEKEGKYLLRTRSSLPASKSAAASTTGPKDFRQVKPPKSRIFINENEGNEGALERVVDQQINKAFQLSQQYKKSKSRGEIWLRLGELYVEKGQLIEFRLQNEFDKKMELYNQKKLSAKPRLNLSAALLYYKKAITLYEWFLRDFPTDPKVDQALFFLGYNYFELGQEKKGTSFYQELTRKFPKSSYVSESNFALAEYHFENDRWKEAFGYYQKVLKDKRSKLYYFAIYKSAWCLFKEGRIEAARKRLEALVMSARRGSTNKASRIRMMSEALKDMVVFYAETGDPAKAQAYFNHFAGDRNTFPLLEKLGYYYADTGNREGARIVFKELIDLKPTGAKTFSYQYQIVQAYSNVKNEGVYRTELMTLVEDYGPDSAWVEVNKANSELVNEALALRESTLRNYVLQMHQTAQNSRAKHSQQQAATGYRMYLKHFANADRGVEMRFFYGELLFDMGFHIEAADEYLKVVAKGNKSQYYEKAMHNALLALEKRLPSEDDIRGRVGDRVTPVPFDESIEKFVAVAKKYQSEFPKSPILPDIIFRVGRLHYSFNHFDEALKYFDVITTKYPRSRFMEYSANLILDIYNLKEDYVGLSTAGTELLKVPEIANSKLAGNIREVIQRSSFKRAEGLVVAKRYDEAAQLYSNFVKVGGESKLMFLAAYNAGVNYEKASKPMAAVSMYNLALARKDVSTKVKRNSKEALGNLYQSMGDYPNAAKVYEQFYKEFPKDPVGLDFLLNAAILRAGLSQYDSAIANYNTYFQKKKGAEKALALYAIADIWKRRGRMKDARLYYEKYIGSNANDLEKIVRSYYEVATIYNKSGSFSQADQWYKKTLAAYRSLSRQKSGVGLRYAAESNFTLVYRNMNDLRKIKIGEGAQAAASLKKASALIDRLNKGMAEVVKMDDAYYVVAALVAIGEANDIMVRNIRSAPIPKQLVGKQEQIAEYRKTVEQQLVRPFAEAAAQNFEAALRKANDLVAFSKWSELANEGLARYFPDKATKKKELTYQVKRVDWMSL